MNYNEAKALFNKAKSKDRGYRMPGRKGKTRLVKTQDGFGIQYVGTVVVEINSKNEYTLNSGGYSTRTTKERIGMYSPASIYQRNFQWYVTVNGVEAPFQDGMKITAKRIVTQTKAQSTEHLDQIKAYVAEFIKAIEVKVVPQPSGGDCWACCMVTQDGKTLGDTSMHDHIKHHIEESYFVPSLLVNAIREAGYNPAFVNPWNGFLNNNDTFKRALTRYLIKRVKP